jgi:hypothetical protein
MVFSSESPNKALHRKATSLRSVAAGELGRSKDQAGERSNWCECKEHGIKCVVDDTSIWTVD